MRNPCVVVHYKWGYRLSCRLSWNGLFWGLLLRISIKEVIYTTGNLDTVSCLQSSDSFLKYLYIEKKNKYYYIHQIVYIVLSTFKALQSKFISMLTFWDKLIITFIQQNIGMCSCNKELLINAEMTLSRSTNIFLQFHSNIPINKIINLSLSIPILTWKILYFFTRFISKRTFMIIVMEYFHSPW